jgi:hypothetical protein
MTDTTMPLIAGYFDYLIHLGVSFKAGPRLSV